MSYTTIKCPLSFDYGSASQYATASTASLDAQFTFIGSYNAIVLWNAYTGTGTFNTTAKDYFFPNENSIPVGAGWDWLGGSYPTNNSSYSITWRYKAPSSSSTTNILRQAGFTDDVGEEITGTADVSSIGMVYSGTYDLYLTCAKKSILAAVGWNSGDLWLTHDAWRYTVVAVDADTNQPLTGSGDQFDSYSTAVTGYNTVWQTHTVYAEPTRHKVSTYGEALGNSLLGDSTTNAISMILPKGGTFTVTPSLGAYGELVGWYDENDNLLSTNSSYTFACSSSDPDDNRVYCKIRYTGGSGQVTSPIGMYFKDGGTWYPVTKAWKSNYSTSSGGSWTELTSTDVELETRTVALSKYGSTKSTNCSQFIFANLIDEETGISCYPQ